MSKTLKPYILLQQPKPLPLVGISPRTLMRPTEWNAIRKQICEQQDNHCICCGIDAQKALFRKVLDCHETYNINWDSGIVTPSEIYGLCWMCHNFVHIDQIVGVNIRRSYDNDTILQIAQYGWKVIREAGLPLKREWRNWNVIPWNEWRLLWNGKYYYSDFYDYNDWRNNGKKT